MCYAPRFAGAGNQTERTDRTQENDSCTKNSWNEPKDSRNASKSWEGVFDLPGKLDRIAELERQSHQVDFWSNSQNAQAVTQELKNLRTRVTTHQDLHSRAEDLVTLIELAAEEGDTGLEEEITGELFALEEAVVTYETDSTLSGEYDAGNCFLSIHPGAGGTESCDWASMLMRMYGRFIENKKWKLDVVDLQPGDEAGVKSFTGQVQGEYAYGLLKAESGVHRLVRISPFDANKRRHTSFASVFVLPELPEDIEVDIDEKDLRIDTYRSSGAGGQHVNVTDSAVRITHLPTGIVVCCQNERSQHKNRATAMKILRARLYEFEQQKHREKIDKFSGDKKEIAWGSQIRSYVFQPYQMVKDLRTNHETSNIQAVMDGELDSFIRAYLKTQVQ